MTWKHGDKAELPGGRRVHLLERASHSTRYWWVRSDIRQGVTLDFIVAETDLKKVREQ